MSQRREKTIWCFLCWLHAYQKVNSKPFVTLIIISKVLRNVDMPYVVEKTFVAWYNSRLNKFYEYDSSNYFSRLRELWMFPRSEDQNQKRCVTYNRRLDGSIKFFEAFRFFSLNFDPNLTFLPFSTWNRTKNSGHIIFSTDRHSLSRFYRSSFHVISSTSNNYAVNGSL